MEYLKLFESFDGIDSICMKYGIKNYTINEDGSVDVEGDIHLTGKNRSVVDNYGNVISKISKLPLTFRNVSGDFYCNYINLTSLEGCPISVGRWSEICWW